MKRDVSVVRLIVATRSSGPPASGKIIKEMPDSVASGTPYIKPLFPKWTVHAVFSQACDCTSFSKWRTRTTNARCGDQFINCVFFRIRIFLNSFAPRNRSTVVLWNFFTWQFGRFLCWLAFLQLNIISHPNILLYNSCKETFQQPGVQGAILLLNILNIYLEWEQNCFSEKVTRRWIAIKV